MSSPVSSPDPAATPPTADAPTRGIAGRLAALFIDSKLTPIAVAASLLLGLFAILMLPREEEPQIKVPMIDVFVGMPGATPSEVENRVTRPIEELLWEIPGVEYLYSTASPGGNLTIVRFKVGTDLEAALVRLNQKLQANFDRIPLGVTPPLVKPRTIDDVPILALTLHSARYDHATLRQIAVQLDDAVKQVPQVAETTVIGGRPRSIRVQLDPQRLAARNLSPGLVVPMLQQAGAQTYAGALPAGNVETLLQVGTFFRDAQEVGAVVLGAHGGRPVYLREVADIVDGPADPADYVLHGAGGPGSAGSGEEAAVTVSIAKRPGANAVDVVTAVLARVEGLKGSLITADVGVETTLKIIERIETRVSKDRIINAEELNQILRDEIIGLLEENAANFEGKLKVDKPTDGNPYVLMVVGVNGVGKTTTIGKLAYQMKQAGLKVVLGASDTFRAAAVDQLIIWADRVGVPIVQQGMGADPASVAFDALQSAKAQGADVVIIDTAGRLHNKVNLMQELSKIKRVMDKVVPNAPHEILLVLDGSTGQNAYEQAKQFAQATDINALAVTKLDGTAKGGVVIGISDQMKIPVKYIGVGEKMQDLQLFDRKAFVESLFK